MNERGTMKEIITITITDEAGNVENESLLSVTSCKGSSPENTNVHDGRQSELTCKSDDEEHMIPYLRKGY